MDEPDRTELVRQLFALVTAGLEDCASMAVEGQARDAPQLDHLVGCLKGQIQDLGALLDAVEAVVRTGS